MEFESAVYFGWDTLWPHHPKQSKNYQNCAHQEYIDVCNGSKKTTAFMN